MMTTTINLIGEMTKLGQQQWRRSAASLDLPVVSIRLVTAIVVIVSVLCSLQLRLASCQPIQADGSESDDSRSSGNSGDSGDSDSGVNSGDHDVSPEEMTRGEQNVNTEALIKKAQDICKDNKVDINSLDEMHELIRFIKYDEIGCKSTFQSSVMELEPMLINGRDRVCDQEFIDMIKHFHFRYIQPMKRANRLPTQYEAYPQDVFKGQLHPEQRHYFAVLDDNNSRLALPIAVRHFFLKFALQVSQHCKLTMIENLERAIVDSLSDQDRDMLVLFNEEEVYGKSLGSAFGELDFDNVVYIEELDGKLRDTNGNNMVVSGQERYVKIETSEESAMVTIVSSCRNSFKPIYDKLIMPIVKLSKLGYDYMGSTGLDDKEREYLNSSKMKAWLAVVHICEIFKNTNLIREMPDDGQSGGQADSGQGDSGQEDSDDGAEKAPSKSLKELFDASENGEVEDTTKAEFIDDEEQEQLVTKNVMVEFYPIDYEPSVKQPIKNELMINNIRDLDTELARKYKNNPHGFRGFLRKAGNSMLKLLGKADIDKFAHYRRHSQWYGTLLNALSACFNIISISVTIKGIAAAAAGTAVVVAG